MKSRKQRAAYSYGAVIDEKSEIFRHDLYSRIGLQKIFAGKDVLDLGCGYGPDTINFSEFSKNVTGYDIEFNDLWKENKRKNIKFVQGSSSSLPFKDNSFDCVYLKDVLHHVEDINKSLKELKRVTKKGGSIIIIEGNRFNPIFYIYSTRLKGHDHFKQSDFEKIVSRQFKNYKIKSIEAYPPFKMPMSIYKKVIKLESFVSKIGFLKSFFSYNIAIIKVD